MIIKPGMGNPYTEISSSNGSIPGWRINHVEGTLSPPGVKVAEPKHGDHYNLTRLPTSVLA